MATHQPHATAHRSGEGFTSARIHNPHWAADMNAIHHAVRWALEA